ncbi:MAG: MBOAT family protein, partial [Flavobacteriales bacterium]|nr:MBOAT family protein [Flavobacteriales bacterium]
YSDIAIGTSKIFGFNLKRNFNYPYFSRDIGEFWRRWHISLSTWFRDYLYIPLGGSRGSALNKLRNVMIIFVVSGFWHGPKWTFVAWGFLNGIYFIPLLLLKLNRSNTNDITAKYIPSFRTILSILITFALTCFAWIFFRASSIDQAFEYIGEVFSGSFLPNNWLYFHPLLLLQIGIFVVVEWFTRTKTHPLTFKKLSLPIRWSIYYLVVTIVLFSANYHSSSDFIYFQF